MNDTNDTNDDTTEANSTVHDLSTERPEDSPTVTVRLSRNQMLTVTNSLGSEAIEARNDDRDATFEAVWGLRDDLKEALEAEL
jgi:hypothetical protein